MEQRDLVAVAVTSDGRRVAVRLGGSDRPDGLLGRVVRRLRALFSIRAG